MYCGRTPIATLQEEKSILEENLSIQFNLTDTSKKSVTVRLGLNHYILALRLHSFLDYDPALLACNVYQSYQSHESPFAHHSLVY